MDLRIAPADAELGRAWRGCRIVDVFTDELLSGGGGIWRNVLAHLLLSREERAAWEALPPARRDPWLRGRAAAKDALRALHGPMPPADVPVAADADGRPYAPNHPGTALSIAHCGQVAVAVAAADAVRVGVDVEPVGPLAAEVAALAFDESERAALGGLAPVRGWCAKEAAAKALGIGIDRGLTALRIVGVDDDRIRLVAADTEVTVATAEDRGLVMATCTVEKEGLEP
jgi:4'-phosphopantetheinyl transferase EntD